MSAFAALKAGCGAVDQERVSDEIWFDIDEAATPRALAPLEAAHPAIGRRLIGLAILCVALFGLATLAGFAAEAYAAPPGPTRIVEAPGAPVEVPAAVHPSDRLGPLSDGRIVACRSRCGTSRRTWTTSGRTSTAPRTSSSASRAWRSGSSTAA